MAGSALSPLAADLRRHDRDRFQTALFAPSPRREALFALYAFNFEVARIREVTHEPMLGRIRLQWWRDAIAEIYAGATPRRHDVAEALAGAIRAHGLSRGYFETLLDARVQDLADGPLPSLAALEAYAAGSSASLVLLALETLGVRDEPAQSAGRAAGTAYALAGLLAAAPFHARMKRVYLPEDLIVLHGVDLGRGFLELKPSSALAKTAQDLAAQARRYLDEARRHRRAVPREALPALLPALLAERRLQRLARLDHNLFDPRWLLPDPTQSWRLAWAALRRRY